MTAYSYSCPLALLLVTIAMGACLLPVSAQEADNAATADATTADGKKVEFKKLKSPVPYTEKSIKRGQLLFRNRCAECHGPDGKAQIDVIADASDLTSPKLYLSGTTEGEIFRSIRDGAGVSMPPYKMQIRREEDMWHLVNFIRSLWPKNMRPKLQKEEVKEETGSSDAKPAENGGDTHE